MAESGITAEELATWLTPLEALTLGRKPFGEEAAATIWGRIMGGAIRTAATSFSRTEGTRGEPVLLSTPTLIPGSYWASYSSGTSPNFWQTGDARFWFPSSRPRVLPSASVRCFGIKLHPDDVRAMLPPAAAEREQPAEAPKIEKIEISQPKKESNKGGRPPKDWWPDLWVEMCRQVYAGDLNPTEIRQADIEKAMLEWAGKNKHDVSEATIRKAAHKLFEVLKAEANN